MLCAISRQERIVSQSEQNSNAIYYGSVPAYKVPSQLVEVGLLLHVVTSARVQLANEFIVCALTRIKRHVYDKLKQHVAALVRRATRPWLRPFKREKRMEYFSHSLSPYCRQQHA
jgi:hypothetical protein